MRALTPLLLTAALLAPAVASADPAPVDLGPGAYPSVAVGPDGAAYVVYNDAEPGTSLYFCKLPRGATACANGGPVHFAPTLGSGQIDPPRIFRKADGTLVVVDGRGGLPNFIEAWTSTDDGVTWTPSPTGDGTVIGRPDVADTSGDAMLSPDGSAVEIIDGSPTTGGVRFQFDPLSGSTATSDFQFSEAGELGGAGGTLASPDASTTVAAYVLQGGGTSYAGTAYSVFSGAPGEAMDTGGWSAPQHLHADGENPHLSHGPAGVGLLEGHETDGALTYSRWTGTGFGAPVTLGRFAPTQTAVAQDGSGRVHAVWTHGFDATLSYTRSDDGGTTWKAPVDFGVPDRPALTGAAVAPDGQGWAVYFANPGPSLHAYAFPLSYPTTPASSLPVSNAPVAPPGESPQRTAHTAPVLSHLHVTPRHVRGVATISYRDSETARTRLTFERILTGIRRGHRCVARPRHASRHSRRCPYHHRVGSLGHTDLAGANRVVFGRRLGGHRLALGSYRLTATARNEVGQTSVAARTTFTVGRR